MPVSLRSSGGQVWPLRLVGVGHRLSFSGRVRLTLPASHRARTLWALPGAYAKTVPSVPPPRRPTTLRPRSCRLGVPGGSAVDTWAQASTPCDAPLGAASSFPPPCGGRTGAGLPGAVEGHQGSHTQAVHDDRHRHHRQGERGQSGGQVGGQPVVERVAQVVERPDPADAKPGDQPPLDPRGAVIRGVPARWPPAGSPAGGAARTRARRLAASCATAWRPAAAPPRVRRSVPAAR